VVASKRTCERRRVIACADDRCTTVDARSGGAQLEVVASSEDPVQGEGGLMVLRFKALAPRPSTSIAAQVSVVGSAGAAIGNSAAPALNIAIQP
jgi:hypothetical protein